MVRVLTVAVLQIVTSFNYTYSGRCSTRHRLFKRLHSTSLTGDILYKGTTFSFSLPLVELTDYKFILEDEEKNKQVLKLFCSSTCSIPQGDVSPFPFMKRKLTVNKKSISIHK